MTKTTDSKNGEKKRTEVLFIVPAYNEQENIAEVIGDLCTVVPVDNILIINDGSEDGTLAAIRDHDVRYIDFPINLGVSSAVQAGFQYALRHGFSYCVQFDGDGQHIAQQALPLIDSVKEGNCDIAIGARMDLKDESSSVPRRIGGRVLSRFLQTFTGNRYSDPTSGLRCYSPAAVGVFANSFPDEYPEVESLVLAKKLGLRVMEFPVSMRPRKAGRSSISFFGSWYYMFKVILASAVMTLRKY